MARLLPAWLPLVAPHSTYIEFIPNGKSVEHPDHPGTRWKAVGHVWPLPPRSLPGTYVPFSRNPFGLDFARNGFRWTRTLCELDSDGDGLSNGQELGDPLCIWQPGLIPTRTTNITHPGVLPLSMRPLDDALTLLSSGFSSNGSIPRCHEVPNPPSRNLNSADRERLGYGGVCFGAKFCDEVGTLRILPGLFPPTGAPIGCPGFVIPWMVMPITALIALVLYYKCSWLPQARWLLVLFLAEYGGVMGIDVAAHRFFSHAAFQTGTLGMHFMSLHLAATIQGKAYTWAFMHRIHHKYCEQAREMRSHPLQSPHWRPWA